MIATGQTAKPQPRRAARRTVGYWLRLVGIALLGGFVAALAVVPPWMADRILHPPRRELTATPADLGVAYEDVTFRGQDVDLSGWYVPGEGNSAVVLVHGFPNDRSNLLALVPALHAAGFSLLLYD